MRVNVDEAGRDVVSGGVDDARRVCAGQRPEGDDATAADGDVGREPGIARAVEDAAVTDEQVVRRLLRRD